VIGLAVARLSGGQRLSAPGAGASGHVLTNGRDGFNQSLKALEGIE